MTFKRINPKRYQVLYPEDHPTVAKRLKASERHRFNPRFAGTVGREEYYTYVNGKRVKRSFWTARTPGYMQLKGQYRTRELAAEPLLKGAISDPW